MTRILLFFLLLLPVTLPAQTGSIRGQVSDARTGEALVGANVVIVGSKPVYGAATDMNGMFLMTKIPPGEYRVQAAYIDYQSATVWDVNVVAGQTTEVNFKMKQEGDTEPVTATPASESATQKNEVVQDDSSAESSARTGETVVQADTVQGKPARESSAQADSIQDKPARKRSAQVDSSRD